MDIWRDFNEVNSDYYDRKGYGASWRNRPSPSEERVETQFYPRRWESNSFFDWPYGISIWTPRCDILEFNEKLRVEFEIPGVDVESISLSATEDTVVLSTGKPKSRKEETGDYYLRERHFGRYYRRLTLPDWIDTRKRSAILENGVLKVTFDRKEGPTGQSVPITVTPHAH